VSDIAPEQYDQVLESLQQIQSSYRGRMLVNAKCAPHFVKTVLASGGDLAAFRAYSGGAGGCPAGTHYLGIRPNGELTPCPYLPVYAGNLKDSSIGELWQSSELFVRIRERAALGGRCGECELAGRCGGCRARAFGMTGDYMAEDPLCTHVPGRFSALPLLANPVVEYGASASRTIDWEPAATERMKRVPAFVRGMVVRAVEESCRKRSLTRVSVEELDRIRASMPTPKLFGRRRTTDPGDVS
jgi:radical SAM protein with 4Fe4S-binding SPASM domain